MSFTLEQRVRFGYFGGSATKKHLLLTLASYADVDGYNAFPSTDTLAAIMECSDRTVQNWVAELENDGYIEPAPTERWEKIPKGQRPNAWRIVVEKIPQIEQKDFREHLKNLRRGTPEESSPPPPKNLRPNKSGYSTTTTSSSVVASTTDTDDEEYSGGRDEGEGTTTTFTEESSAENEKLEESDTQTDPHSFTASPPAVAESISVAAPASHQQTTNPPVEGPLPRDTSGSQNGAQSLEGIQNPDRKARNEWRPKPGAIERAKEIAPDVNLEIEIVSYWIWVYEQGITPTDTHWMRRVMNEQRKHDAKKEADLRQRTLDQRIEKPWYEKELRF